MNHLRTERYRAEPVGLVIHAPRRYDLSVWLITRGREGVFRDQLLDLVEPRPGEAVLDVGCGTGGLAIAARRRVGPTGSVAGVDPSPEMIRRASGKARKARLDIGFIVAAAQALPFADGTFDMVLCTLVLHQLPHDGLQQCLAEMRRVLKPDGRLLLVDMGGPQDDRPTVHARVAEVRPGPEHRHAFDLDGVTGHLGTVGLRVVSSGPITFPLRRLEQLRYVVATPAL